MKTLNVTRKDDSQHLLKVDDKDEHFFYEYSWSIHQVDNCFYAQTMKNRSNILLHCLILPTDLDVDHVDGNGLNNQRSNLRIATRSENLGNQRPQVGCSSKYKGVSWDKSRKKWLAYIKYNQVRYTLGRFENEIDAAAAYDKAAYEVWGDFARLNLGKKVTSA